MKANALARGAQRDGHARGQTAVLGRRARHRDSSLRKDRLVKAPLHAASGFEEYWVVNIAAKVVEVHRRPGRDGWASVTRHGREDTIAPLAFPDLAVAVADFLR
ncbi:MAG: Uma2 family endonuclease [Labilithrix sp.]|nr:Uma2 family endonuclease [Labilithrix sp.]